MGHLFFWSCIVQEAEITGGRVKEDVALAQGEGAVNGNPKRRFFLSSKITADGDRSHEIKRHLLLGRKPVTNLDSVLKSRDITLPTKICIVKAVIFPLVMYGCESWTVKKAEHQRIDAFELQCWRKLSRVSWTSKISNQSILKEINPEYSLEGLMVEVKNQCFGH